LRKFTEEEGRSAFIRKAELRRDVFLRRENGGKGIRTPDFQLAKLALYQLSYAPNPIADFRLPIADCKFRRSQTAATVSWVSAFLIRFFCTNKMPDVDLAIRNPALQSMCSKD
jgi:hypothetical protein